MSWKWRRRCGARQCTDTIAERAWRNPLDPGFARARGGRWNPPDSYPTLYLNEDLVTARLNLRAFISNWPFEPEDLRADTGPLLIGATLQHAGNGWLFTAPGGGWEFPAFWTAMLVVQALLGAGALAVRLPVPALVPAWAR